MSASEIRVDATQVEAVQKPLLPSTSLSKFSAHHFSPSPSGVDSNLLILLHGLGDSDTGFFGLGKNLQKTLPQTAVLTLQAPHSVPFLEGPHWMWYPSFDQLGELLTKPNPTNTVALLTAVVQHLVSECGWQPSSIHLFGFGQGASIALELLVNWSHADKGGLGSVVSVAGELISHPTLEKATATPVMHMYRSQSDVSQNSTKWASFRKATSALQLHRLPGEGEAMLRGSEWDGVMRFWSKLLRSRTSWELKGEVVHV